MECFFGGVSPGCQGLGCGQGQGAQVYVELKDLSDRLDATATYIKVHFAM